MTRIIISLILNIKKPKTNNKYHPTVEDSKHLENPFQAATLTINQVSKSDIRKDRIQDRVPIT